jgi:hypothetical protein
MGMIYAGGEVKTTRKLVYSPNSVTCSSIIGVSGGANSGCRPGRFLACIVVLAAIIAS